MSDFTNSVEEGWAIFVIHDNYKWTLLVTLIMCLHYLVATVQGGGPRRTLFN